MTDVYVKLTLGNYPKSAEEWKVELEKHGIAPRGIIVSYTPTGIDFCPSATFFDDEGNFRNQGGWNQPWEPGYTREVFESWAFLKDTRYWEYWLEEQRAGVIIELEDLPLVHEDMAPWRTQDDGSYGRSDGLFWRVRGQQISITRPDGLKARWAQPLIEPEAPIHGHLVLVKVGVLGCDEYLLCADMAPGLETLELRPTLQASVSKLTQQPDFPRADLEQASHAHLVNYDGNVYLHKQNRVGVAHFPSREDFYQDHGDLRPNERWFTRGELQEVIASDEANDHLLVALAIALI
jgi:hypothetical protein